MDAGDPAGQQKDKGQAGKIVTFTILFLLIFKDDAKITPLIAWGEWRGPKASVFRR